MSDSIVYVGIDDTDMPDSPGTNKIARSLAIQMAPRYHCKMIVRHQLLFDPRVPYTSKNSSASLQFVADETSPEFSLPDLIETLRGGLRAAFVFGSDPGLCVTTHVAAELVEFGHRCQEEVVAQSAALSLAQIAGVHLEALGGTGDGVIGALAAVGLASTGHDGRIVQLGSWPDDLSGLQPVKVLHERGIDVLRIEQPGFQTASDDLHNVGGQSDGSYVETKDQVSAHCQVDVGKHLRPNYRQGRAVVFAAPLSHEDPDLWKAVRLT